MNPGEPIIPANDGVDSINITIGGVPGSTFDTQADKNSSADNDSFIHKNVPDKAYTVTLILVTRKGALVTKVVDSRCDNIEEAWEQMMESEESKQIVYRLILSEDLPRTTERQLEKLLQGDRSLLIDHAANKCISSLPSWEEERFGTEFHMNISEPPAAISVALPYEIHGIIELPFYDELGHVDLNFARRTYEQLWLPINGRGKRGHSLHTAWLPLPPCGYRIQNFLYMAYRRISIRFISPSHQQSPMCK